LLLLPGGKYEMQTVPMLVSMIEPGTAKLLEKTVILPSCLIDSFSILAAGGWRSACCWL
jgi:hypothetical protein